MGRVHASGRDIRAYSPRPQPRREIVRREYSSWGERLGMFLIGFSYVLGTLHRVSRWTGASGRRMCEAF